LLVVLPDDGEIIEYSSDSRTYDYCWINYVMFATWEFRPTQDGLFTQFYRLRHFPLRSYHVALVQNTGTFSKQMRLQLPAWILHSITTTGGKSWDSLQNLSSAGFNFKSSAKSGAHGTITIFHPKRAKKFLEIPKGTSSPATAKSAKTINYPRR